MTMHPDNLISAAQEGLVLRKSLINMSILLDLNQREVAAIIGMSEGTTSRLFTGEKKSLDPNSKSGEIALILLRIYRSLDAIFGGQQENCRRWFKSNNHHLGGKPCELVTQLQGLILVAQYLDMMRGKF